MKAGAHELQGKVAIVTGAGRGLGRAMALALIDAGVSVVLAARTTSELDAIVDQAEERPGRALACSTDVTDEASVIRMVETTVEAFGRVDVLVNNAGIVASTPLLEQSAQEWNRVIATNLQGTYLATRAVGRHLVAQGAGKVINVASNFALQGVANHAAYSASKAGVIAFTKAMAVEWSQYGVQVNAIAPGYFATPLNQGLRDDAEAYAKVLRAIPARRMGAPEEITPWVVLLAGHGSDFMTGEVMVLDGGQSVR